MLEIPLTGKKAQGRVVLIDDNDLELIAPYSWYLWEEVRKRGLRGPYALAGIKRDGRWGIIKMHKLITGWDRTDHIDGNGLNNQRSNLRPASSQQNQANSRSVAGSSSLYKGVTWSKDRERWVAQIRVDGKQKHLGRFTDETDAAKAYDDAARRYFGEYARLNFL